MFLIHVFLKHPVFRMYFRNLFHFSLALKWRSLSDLQRAFLTVLNQGRTEFEGNFKTTKIVVEVRLSILGIYANLQILF